MLRGTSKPLERHEAYNTFQLEARHQGRNISHASIARKLHNAEEYNRIHADPEEQFQIYGVQEEYFGDSPLEYECHPTPEQIIRRKKLYDQFNNQVINLVSSNLTSPRPGETYSSPRVKIVNYLKTNRPKNYTGYREGVPYTEAYYGFGSEANYDPTSMRDDFSEIIENRPRAKLPKPNEDYLEGVVSKIHTPRSKVDISVPLWSLENRDRYGNTFRKSMQNGH